MSVLGWATRRWQKVLYKSNTETKLVEDKLQPEGDWWAVKASAGNGGGDVYFINEDNYQTVLPTIPKNMEYVIQKYVMGIYIMYLCNVRSKYNNKTG